MLFGGLFALVYFEISSFELNPASYSRESITYEVVFCLVILVITPIFLPIYKYIKYGKNNRINDVTGFFDVPLIADYFDQFFKGDKNCMDKTKAYRKNPADYAAQQDLRTAFDSIIIETFGSDRIQYVTIVFFVVSFVVLFFAIAGGIQLARNLSNSVEINSIHFLLGIKPDITSIAAVFGAYTWITSDAIYRYRLNDFNSSDILWYALRFIVAIPLGEAVAAFAPLQTVEGKVLPISSAGPLLAFVISMFSFSSIQQILSSFINRAYNLPTTTAETREDALIRLPDIDQVVADRLAAEGVTTMGQLVNTDPVLLCSHTAIPFRCILDYVNAAMLWKIVGEKLLILRTFGWQGTSQIIAFSERQMKLLIININNYNHAKRELMAATAAVDSAKQALANDLDNASLNTALETAKTALNQSQAKYDAAEIPVRNVPPPADESIFADMSEKTGMAKSAFAEIKSQVKTDSYAWFIYKIGFDKIGFD
jgi:hypothetical protein